MQPGFVHSQYFCSYPISNIILANYLVNEFNTFKISKILDFCEIINPEISIHRDHLIETSFRVSFYNKQINVKKYEWKFGSVQILLVGDCIISIFLFFSAYLVIISSVCRRIERS